MILNTVSANLDVDSYLEMLDFCAEHGVKPAIELIGADDVGNAYDRVLRSDVH